MTGDGRQPGSRPPPSLAGASWLEADAPQTVLRVLAGAGFEARVVGGAVRNALFGQPVRDVDIATPAVPEDVIATCEAHGLRTVPTGLKHGTVTVIVDDEPIEVTTLREDVATDGRHAEVRFTTLWEADASRRDFTINALYCDAAGTIHDPLGGLGDIATRTIRFIGVADDRIAEDYLRVLRFFRFFSEYGVGAPDAESLAACIRSRSGIRRLSGERLRQELLKLLVAPRALAALEAMADFGLWGEIFPTVPRLSHLARMIGARPRTSANVRLACAAVRTADEADAVASRLRLSNAERGVLLNIAASPSKCAPPSIAIAKQWLYQLGPADYSDRIAFLATRSFRDLADAAWHDAALLPKHWHPPEFPLSGRDALALGMTPGPLVGISLRQIEKTWIASRFQLSKKQLLDELRNVVGDTEA